jgi:Na+-driven multidrug efflux pump
MNKDLTTGKPETVLWQFCLPLFGSIIFQQLYNIADSLVAGKFVGENALAAVGNSYEITLIFIAFAFGCNIGCSVVVSTFFGAKRMNEVKTAVSTALIASGVLCLVLMLIGTLFCGNLLELIRTPQEVFADSKLYLLTEELFASTLVVIVLSLLLQKIMLRLLKGRDGNA